MQKLPCQSSGQTEWSARVARQKLCIRPNDVEGRARPQFPPSFRFETRSLPNSLAATLAALPSSRLRPAVAGLRRAREDSRLVSRQLPLRSTAKHSAQVAIPTLRPCRSSQSLDSLRLWRDGEAERSENGIRKRRTPNSVKERGSHGASPAQRRRQNAGKRRQPIGG